MTVETARRKQLARRLLSLLDLTSLNDTDDPAAVRLLCERASTPAGKVAAVCIWPRFVPIAALALRGSGIPVAAVANFPAGGVDAATAARETADAVAAGAREIDVVFPWSVFRAGDAASPLALVRACRNICGAGVVLKVILETGQLGSDELIRHAAHIAIEGGADFLKTSTGKTQPGATPGAAAAMLDVIGAEGRRGRAVGFKASGGVRTIAEAEIYLGLFESRFGVGSATSTNFRIGASALLTEVLAALGPLA